MLRWCDDHQLIAMNQHDGKAIVGHGKRNDAKIDRVIDYRFQNLGVVGARDADVHVRILSLKFREYLWQNVQASAFIGSDDDLAFGYAFVFGDRREHHDRHAVVVVDFRSGLPLRPRTMDVDHDALHFDARGTSLAISCSAISIRAPRAYKVL